MPLTVKLPSIIVSTFPFPIVIGDADADTVPVPILIGPVLFINVPIFIPPDV